MSAQNKLSGPQFFHGTKVPLEPGDMIEPGHPTGWLDTAQDRRGRATHVYASKDVNDAAYFADEARNPAPPKRDERTGLLLQTSSAHGRRYVYEVEPTGQMRRDPNEALQPWYTPERAVGFRSRQPLRVKRTVRTWDPETDRGISRQVEREA